ncbi:MAG: hypothetical protein ACREMO_07605 [Gemmatimonadales bacterium]
MSTPARILSLLTLAALLSAPRVTAQEKPSGSDAFKWYIGPHAGALFFETQNQTRGTMIVVGGHVLITARRTGLLLSVEEGIKRNQISSVADATGPAGRRTVTFNDLRRYSAVILAFPIRHNPQPFLGLGFGIMQTAKEYPDQTGLLTPTDVAAASSAARSAGSYGFGSLAGGIQWQSSRFGLFAQYQITTAPNATKLLVGPTHAFTGGLRLSLGGSREGITGGSY